MRSKRATEEKLNRDAQYLVEAIIYEKLHHSPVINTSNLLLARWLYNSGLNRVELAGLKNILTSKEKADGVDCSQLIAKITQDLELFPKPNF